MEMPAPLTLAGLLERVVEHRLQAGPRARVAFVLHPGGAAGAYQAGALHALAEAGLRPDLIVGTSIGAFNGLGFWLDELTGRAPGAPAPATRLGRLWRVLGHRGRASRLLLDKPYLLGWITGRPDWRQGMCGSLAGQLVHPADAWEDLQRSVFKPTRLERFTRHVVASALGLSAGADARTIGHALTRAARQAAPAGHPPPDLVVVATDVAAHAPVGFVLGDPAISHRLQARGWAAADLGQAPLDGSAALDVFYASASIPAVFPQRELVVHAGEPARVLVDGVIGNNRPFQLAVEAGATLVISLEVEAAVPVEPYPVGRGSHFVSAAAEAFMTVGDHFVRDSARELALVNRAMSRGAGTHDLVVPCFRLAPVRRRLGLLEFDGHWADGALETSLYDDFMFGYAEAGGAGEGTWQDYKLGHAHHGDRGKAVLAATNGSYLDATFAVAQRPFNGPPAPSGELLARTH